MGLTTPPCKTWICCDTSTEEEWRKKVGEAMARKWAETKVLEEVVSKMCIHFFGTLSESFVIL
jgi:hypothetical protein